MTEKLFEDGVEGVPRQRLKSVKSYRQAKAELVDPDQVWKSKYKPEFCDKLIEVSSKGLSVRAFCALIEVSSPTVYKWAAEIPEFKEAMQIAEMKRHLFYEGTALKNLNNKDFNNTLFIKLAATVGRWQSEDESAPTQRNSGEFIHPEMLTQEQRRKRILELTKQIEVSG